MRKHELETWHGCFYATLIQGSKCIGIVGSGDEEDVEPIGVEIGENLETICAKLRMSDQSVTK